MDISDVNKAAGRKRACTDVEKLREKVSRENKKIIKLKVAQDTAYWDLKEQLRQVETNHEKLQQNMVEVQMQYESISGKYQEELRQRPETLNKLSCTREICDVLEDYSERLRDTLSRCKADQAALYEAYQKSGQVVRELKTQQSQANDKSRQIIDNLQDKLKMSTEHHTQLFQLFTAEKQRTDSEVAELRNKLSETLSQREELIACQAELGRKFDQSAMDVEKKQETIASLQRDIKQLIQEFNSQGSEMQNTIMKQDRDLKEATASYEALKQALTNQEAFTKSVSDQNNQLLDKVAALEEELASAGKMVKELQAKLENVTQTTISLNTEVVVQTEKKEALEKEVEAKNQLLANAEDEIRDLKEQLSIMETRNSDMTKELEKTGENAKLMQTRMQELTAVGQEMEQKIRVIGMDLTECRDAAEAKIQQLSVTIETKDKELDSNASTINRLISDVKSGADERCKLEAVVLKLKKEMEYEREAAVERERKLAKQVEALEGSVRNKDSELSGQMNIIRELRTDKERLHDNIERMQSKINNIQKEITGAPPAFRASRILPEQDDNAVMLTPTTRKNPANLAHAQAASEFARPRIEPDKFESMLFNFLSDNSMDGDSSTLDPVEVNRRFEALSRGERISPMPIPKRRSRSPAARAGVAHGGLRMKAPDKEENLISLSQAKDNLKNKEKMFFKNKKNENKQKKTK